LAFVAQRAGFFADGKLNKIAITGGAAIVLADAPSTRGGVWSDDGTIVLSPHQLASTHLLRIGPAHPIRGRGCTREGDLLSLLGYGIHATSREP
jgi:hypothetical protein